MAGQNEVGEFWACSLLDLYGWTAVPNDGSAPAVAAGRARLYYNSSDNTVHIINNAGADLLVNNTPISALTPTNALPLDRLQIDRAGTSLSVTVASILGLGAAALAGDSSSGVTGVALASGDNTILPAVSSGKQTSSFFVHNTTAGAISAFLEASIDGGTTWFRLAANQSVAANANATIAGSIVQDTVNGAIVGVNSSAPGLTIYGFVTQSSSSPVFSPIKTPIVSGNNTLYTVPDGQSLPSRNLNVNVSNETGGAISVAFHAVPPGGSPTLANRFGVNASLANLAVFAVTVFFDLPAGYSIVLVSNSSGKQFAWGNLVLYPA